MGITIRRVCRHDLGELVALIRRVWVATYFAGQELDEAAASYLAATFSEQQLRAASGDAHQVLLVAEVAAQGRRRKIAGYLHLAPTDPHPAVTGPAPIELEHLYVDQRWHGAGVGPALLQAGLELARQLGHQTIWLSVLASNHRARAFYRRWRFTDVGTLLFQLGDGHHENRVLQRALDTTSTT